MDTEALYQMGYAPQPGTEMPTDFTTPDPGPSFNEGPSLTDEDLLAGFVPGYSGQEPAAPQVPATVEEEPQVVEAAPPPAVAKDSQNRSTSERGYSEAKYKKTKSAEGDFRNAQAGVVAQENAKGAEIVSLYENASRLEDEAVDDLTNAQIEEQQRRAEAGLTLAKVRQETATGFEELQVKAQALNAENRARYEASLAEFRASKVNPSQLFQSMGKGDQIGTLASVFVADFLGAKGIKTSVMDTLNKAIDRNIESQIHNIKIKGEAAQGFRDLYDMQRAESASEAEAFVRMRGFVLDAAEQEVDAHMLQFSTGLTQAKGLAAKAKLQAEKAKNLFEVQRYVDANTNARVQQELQVMTQRMQAAQHAQSMSVAWARERREARAEENRIKAASQANVIVDPSKGYAPAWEWRQGVPADIQKETLGKITGTKIMSDNTTEYRELLRKAQGNNGVIEIGRLAPTDVSRLRSLQIKILSDDVLRRSGKAATDAERASIEARIPLNKAGTRADVESVISQFEKNGYEELEASIGQYTTPLVDGDERKKGPRGTQGMDAPFAQQKIDAAETAANEGKTPTLPADNATQGLQRKDATKAAADDTLDRAIDEGAKPNTEWASYKGPGKTRQMATGGVLPETVTAEVPAYAVHLSTLKAQAEKDPTGHAAKQLKMYAGIGEEGPVQVLPDGTDANSAKGKAMRGFARHEWSLYQQAVDAGVIK